jgi:hypothetical protein
MRVSVCFHPVPEWGPLIKVTESDRPEIRISGWKLVRPSRLWRDHAFGVTGNSLAVPVTYQNNYETIKEEVKKTRLLMTSGFSLK